MSAGIDDSISVELVGQEAMLTRTSEGELKDSHSRQMKAGSQLFDPCGNETQIFGYEGKFAKSLFNLFEKLSAGPWGPLAGLRGRTPRGNLPSRIESAKMIEPNKIHHGKSST